MNYEPATIQLRNPKAPWDPRAKATRWPRKTKKRVRRYFAALFFKTARRGFVVMYRRLADVAFEMGKDLRVEKDGSISILDATHKTKPEGTD